MLEKSPGSRWQKGLGSRVVSCHCWRQRWAGGTFDPIIGQFMPLGPSHALAKHSLMLPDIPLYSHQSLFEPGCDVLDQSKGKHILRKYQVILQT